MAKSSFWLIFFLSALFVNCQSDQDEVTTISPVNGARGHNIYPPLHVLFMEQAFK